MATIQFAEMLSCSICERCGATHDVVVEGAWRNALCSDCRGTSTAPSRERDDLRKETKHDPDPTC